MVMVSEFARSTSAPQKNTPDDPWATATLPRDSSQNSWMISYIDTLLLLTTLLVVLLALQRNTVEKSVTDVKTAQVADLSQTPTNRQPPLLSHNSCPPLSPSPHTRQMGSPSVVPTPESATEAGRNADEKVAAVSAQRTESVSRSVPWDLPDDLKDQVEITHDAKHIRLEVKDTLLFESGSADLKAQAATVLESLLGMLQRHPGGIAVEGHTDDRPIATARYPSNWELSAARASTVARYLIMHSVAADRVQAIGYGDTRPRSANDSAEGRARNRRVTLVMYPSP
jgi:chemotaxis protein MotB